MDINEMADKVMAILRNLEEDTKAAVKEGAQSAPLKEQSQTLNQSGENHVKKPKSFGIQDGIQG